MFHFYKSVHPVHHTFSTGREKPFSRLISSNLFLGVGLIVSWFFCIWIGYHLHGQNATEAEWKAVTFQYNRTFSMKPSVESDQAWQDLFPINDGFVQSASGSISVSSVFHQLHCLNTLRQVIYELLDEVNDANLIYRSDEHSSHRRAHAMHCFDYLRQGIQCSADASVEEVIPELEGVSGWGTVHYCRDFDQLRAKLS